MVTAKTISTAEPSRGSSWMLVPVPSAVTELNTPVDRFSPPEVSSLADASCPVSLEDSIRIILVAPLVVHSLSLRAQTDSSSSS